MIISIASGAIAVRHESKTTIYAQPEAVFDQLRLFRELYELCSDDEAIAYINRERQQGNGPAAIASARRLGRLEALLTANFFLYEFVDASDWQTSLGALPSGEIQRNRHIKAMMIERFPEVRVTLGTAEALALLSWACPAPRRPAESLF